MTRRGMTLVEMLVAMTATLLIMAAVAQAFSAFGDAVSGGRSVLELDAKMRSAAWRLRSDLAGATARPLPPLNPAAGEGYLEIIEGPANDYQDATLVSTTGLAVSGDHDDAILLTTRSTETPFIGRMPTNSIDVAQLVDTAESTLAEVGWFARPTPGTANPVTYTLYRKQLLVMGYVGKDPFHSGLGENNAISLPETAGTLTVSSSSSAIREFYNLPCDISVRREANVLYPNTLADLTRRENRFMHNPLGLTGTSAFPFIFAGGDHQVVILSNPAQLPAALSGLTFDPVIDIDDNRNVNVDEEGERSQRQGEDVLLTNVLAFDVRVFDPAVPARLTAGNTVLVPGDPGFNDASIVKTGTVTGAYVDLGHGAMSNSLLTGIVPHFSGTAQAKSQLNTAAPLLRVYDTWSLHYEANGLNENDNWIDRNNNGIREPDTEDIIDDAQNGLDNNGDGVIDDPGEFETSPPYPYPLRGIEVRIRCYEPSSRQVRQVTVRHTFVPH